MTIMSIMQFSRSNVKRIIATVFFFISLLLPDPQDSLLITEPCAKI